MIAHVGMVGSNHKDCILIPWHRLCLIKELAQGIVSIANTLVNRQAFLLESAFILLWYHKRMMRRGGEEGRHKWLPHLPHLGGIELLQFTSQATHIVEGSRGKEEWLHKHRDAR